MSGIQEKKVRRGRDDWARLMAEYEGSGLTQRGFCEHRGIAYSTFGYWRTRLRRRAAVIGRGVEPVIELCAMPAGEGSTWRVELDLGQGMFLRLK